MNNISHNVLIKVNTKNKNKLLIKIYEIGCSINNIEYQDKFIQFTTTYKDYQKMKKYLLSYKFKIIKNMGIYNLLSKIKENKVFILNIFLALILMFIFSNTIVSVKVIHSKKYIREIVENSLNDYGVKRLSWKKTYNELENIKNKILKKYPQKLEWLEIEKKGMTYIIRVEERIITKKVLNKDACNIIATKDGIITKLNYTKGVEVKNVGDYVKKGDVLISGEIKLNEEIKDYVCASGEVYAETFYESTIKLPNNYELINYTGKKRYNLSFNNTKIFKSRLKNYKTKKKKIFSIFHNNIYLLTEKEINIKNKKYNSKEGLEKAINLSHDKINLKLSQKEHIIYEKVLKNNINDSTIYVEVFTSVEENISEQKELIKNEKEVE